MLPSLWLESVEPHLPGSPTDVTRLDGGDASDVFRIRGASFDLVLHALPSWANRERIEWVHAAVLHAHASVPEVVSPLPLGDSTHLDVAGRLLTVTPYVPGSPLNRDDEAHRVSAARLLARIHRSFREWPEGSTDVPGPGGPRRPEVPAELEDGSLDAWWRTVRPTLMQAVTHGDYYRDNLLCDADGVIGVVDWHEARVQPLLVELAAATFEICRDENHRLIPSRAGSFLRAYRSERGPIAPAEYQHLLGAMRVWVRYDALTSMAFANGASTEYAKAQMRAFDELRALESTDLTLVG